MQRMCPQNLKASKRCQPLWCALAGHPQHREGRQLASGMKNLAQLCARVPKSTPFTLNSNAAGAEDSAKGSACGPRSGDSA